MENLSKHFLELVLLIVLISIGHRYYQYIINRNFFLEVNVTCDPKTEKCFTSSPELSFGQDPYKKVKIIANIAPNCLEEHDCQNFSCPINVKNKDDCEITYCSDESKISGESCVN